MTFFRSAHPHALPVFIAGLIFAAFGCGVYFRGFDTALFVPGGLLVALAAFVMLLPGMRQGWVFPAAPAAGFLALFWLWMGLSLSWSQVPYVSMVFFIVIGSLPLLFFSILQHQRADHLIRALWFAMAGAGAVLAVWAMIQFVFLHDLAGSRVHHPFLNTNNLSVILSMSFFFLLFYFCGMKRGARILAGALMLCCLAGVLATQSRGGSLGLLAGIALFTVLCRKTVQQDWRIFLGWAVLAVVVTIAVLLNAASVGDQTLRLLGGADAGASAAERVMLWSSAWQMIRDQPFPGPGLGVFYLIFPRYRNLQDSSDGFFLHVDPWQLGIEMSLVATVLFYAFGIATLTRFIRAMGRSTPGDAQRPALILPFCGLLVLMLNAHVNFDLYMLSALLMGAVLLAAGYYQTEHYLPAMRLTVSLRNRAQATFMIPVLVILLIAVPVWLVRAGVGTRDVAAVSTAIDNNDMQTARARIDHALRYAPQSDAKIPYMDAVWNGQILQSQFMALDAQQRETLFNNAQDALNRVFAQNPYHIQAMTYQSLLYVVAYPRLDPQGLIKAEAILLQARTLDPVNFDVRMGLATIYQRQGKIDLAIAALEGSLEYKVGQQYAPAAYIVMLANLKAQSGDIEGGRRLVEGAQERAALQMKSRQSQTAIDDWITEKWTRLLRR